MRSRSLFKSCGTWLFRAKSTPLDLQNRHTDGRRITEMVFICLILVVFSFLRLNAKGIYHFTEQNRYFAGD